MQFNQKLHSSKLYNGFQFTVSALAVFSGSTYNSMKKHQETLTCFVAGTMILTASGLVAIENIKAGDKVISTYPETMETSPKTVLETYIREVTTLVHLTVNGEEIVTTVDHPFYVKNQGFIKAGELIVGDELLDVNGNVLLVENFDVELTDDSVKVYNFQVEDFHTYFVGNCKIWVHDNDCVNKVESGETELKTKQQKGNYCEMKMDDHYENSNFSRMGDDRIVSLDDKIHHGIDGVYKNNNPNVQPKYVVAEAKYGSSQLGNTKNSGRQMSDAWISKNLDKVVGPEVADDILTEGYSRELFRVKTSPGTNGGVKATTSVKTIDSKGYVVK